MEIVEVTVDVKKFETPFVANCGIDNEKLTRQKYDDRHTCLKVQREMRCRYCIESTKL